MKRKPKTIKPLFCATLLIFGSLEHGVYSADNTPAATPEGPPAAVKTSFESVVSRLDPNGHLYAYLSTEQALARLGEGLEGLITLAKTGTEAGSSLMDNPFVAPIIEGVLGVVEPAYRQSGIGEISGVG
ncbi:uncharacterized protein METZ01_LOCUS435092, partial [marine metagenome]